MVSKGGALVFRNVDRKEEKKSVVDQMHLELTANCSDVDAEGKLWVESVRKGDANEEEERFISRYSPVAGEQPITHSIRGTKSLVRIFRHYVVEVKKERNQSEILIYDFANEMVLFTHKYPGIIALEAESDAIYVLCQVSRESKMLLKLSE